MNLEPYPIIELVVKIASRCNLNCTYCYEYNQGDDSWKKASKFMSIETAIQLGKRIQEHISEHKLKEYNIGLHGGEPLLMSPKKIDELTSCIKNQIDPNINLFFGMQTNGALITKEHIKILKTHNICISVSLDGLKKTNDKFRVDLKGRSSWDRVITGINLLLSEAPELFKGVLSVIDIDADPLETFDFLASFDVDIDFLLPLHTFDKPPYYPNNKKNAYGEWYFEIYKAWINGRNSHIDVRFIKNIVVQLMGGSAIYEVMTSSPIGLLTISTDGGIEGVDCLKVTGRGTQITGLNIFENSLTDSLSNELVKLRQSGISDLHNKCKSCKYLYGCAGGYFPNRYSDKDGFNNPSVYCDDLFWLLSSIENDLLKRTKNERATI
tara:strand:+ start:1857 stop:2999 length:1143 start_codon:yes stop_codon:yes gene_type:complete